MVPRVRIELTTFASSEQRSTQLSYLGGYKLDACTGLKPVKSGFADRRFVHFGIQAISPRVVQRINRSHHCGIGVRFYAQAYEDCLVGMTGFEPARSRSQSERPKPD